MKRKFTILLLGLVCMTASVQLTSCSDDDLGPTIFDTKEYPLDRNSYTFPLDTFVKVNFLEPYNMRFIYRMEYIGSDMDKNLTPASYEKSKELAVLTKYLWYDVYKKLADEHEVFLKRYSPRIIHVIGSKNLNTSSGTETLGVTEGGTKITLFRTNLLDPSDIDNLNEFFFETMHHEFGHILDQTKLHPTTFNVLSNGRYNAVGWSDVPDSVAASQGFISSYASASYTEDWVETLARYITRDSIALENLKHTAEYEWEEVELTDKNGDEEVTPSDYSYMLRGRVNIDTVGYFKDDKSGKGEYKVFRRVCLRDGNDNVILGDDGKPQWEANITGARQIIEEKIRYVAEYMKTLYGVDIEKLRNEVQARQFVKGSDGQFLTEEYYSPSTLRIEKRLVNAITYPNPDGSTVLSKLLDELESYKALQTK
jgi:substrate import-associated zinc metallohydrolase lipoprotein